MTITEAEIESQPAAWERVGSLTEARAALPNPGEYAVVIGCGTSWFMAQAYAAMRESQGFGRTDATIPTEVLHERPYDVAIAISRSGTTTEVIEALREFRARGIRTILITAVADGPQAPFADHEIVLDFADEQSVVQTVFATTALTLLRAGLGHDVAELVTQGNRALEVEIPQPWIDAEQITFLGRGWTTALASEAALKNREASQSWVESYPAMDYRHGPIAIAERGRVVFCFGEPPVGLPEQVAETGAEFVAPDLDPQAVLVVAQRLAVARALARGLDPDRPRHLTRAVILP